MAEKTINAEQISEQFTEYCGRAEETLRDGKRTEAEINTAWEKLKKNADKYIKAVKEDICLFLEVLHAYVSGRYREIPYKTLAMILGAVTYFSWPFDLIFDLIPVIGFFDDVFVITMVLKFAHDDLQKFKAWKTAK